MSTFFQLYSILLVLMTWWGTEGAQQTCTTASYDHTIRIKNCQPKVIRVKLCEGTCSSRTSPTGNNFCSRCYPSHQKNVTVAVICPKNPTGKIKIVSYLKVKRCRCRKVSCPKWEAKKRNDALRGNFQLYVQ